MVSDVWHCFPADKQKSQWRQICTIRVGLCNDKSVQIQSAPQINPNDANRKNMFSSDYCCWIALASPYCLDYAGKDVLPWGAHQWHVLFVCPDQRLLFSQRFRHNSIQSRCRGLLFIGRLRGCKQASNRQSICNTKFQMQYTLYICNYIYILIYITKEAISHKIRARWHIYIYIYIYICIHMLLKVYYIYIYIYTLTYVYIHM